MSMPDEVRRIIEAPGSVSDKIRRLDREGVPRAQIARYLEKRYQHVRNVLEAETTKRRSTPIADAAPAIATDPRLGSFVERFAVELDGTVRIPAALLAGLGVGPGETLVVHRTAETANLMSGRTALDKARALFREIIPAGTNAVDDFLTWKHAWMGEERG